ncbi:epidermal growth factor receptor substrate 15-like 1 isoform X3 [Lingula anatina]|uniref:Epidermal growth factor receptor substrate 15-like 1 isoform X3 n=1 Tax=Lingula anatina TaxID=7574 RepID=A0A1S3H5M9_LINAN|nr:epidermal growth factor receptor substrate 15-like 1 isoform X3 [Lingula anatina]|eukprot:XP_013381272.1 epidermal growth factor receptor substrate 15-like 1 isoform X3 [Lingula anatina]
MAVNFPPLPQVAGAHSSTYEAYFQQADSNGTGAVGAMEAANFMKKSGLKEKTLSQIWDLADPAGKGYLDKHAFFVALKFIAMAQNGLEVSMANIGAHTPPPKMGEPASPAMQPLGAAPADWAIKTTEKAKYDQIFDGLQPIDGKLSGDKVRPMLLNSKLPVDVLGRVWDLSDIDKDGQLDREEFAIAMHLVYRALENDPVPPALPTNLVPPSKRRSRANSGVNLPGAVPVLPSMSGGGAPTLLPGRSSPAMGSTAASTDLHSGMTSPGPQLPWVVPQAERAKFEALFKTADKDMDGFVLGGEVRDIFIQSGLSQQVLAHIWTLCDIKGTGKLNSDQFALAMHLIQQKLNGVEPPQTLAPEMIPPSMRERSGSLDSKSYIGDYSAVKELDMISKEIEDMKREKIQLEQNKAQRDADIKIRSGEVQTLQKELDAINNTIQQLETQKGEAQKRLDELDDTKSKLELAVKEAREKCEKEQREVDTLRSEIASQEKSLKTQEEDLAKMKIELNTLKQEETELEKKRDNGKLQLNSVEKSIKDSSAQINQTKAKIQQLQETQRNIQETINQYDKLLTNGDISSPEPVLKHTPAPSEGDVASFRATTGGSSPMSSLSGFSTDTGIEDFKEDPFKNHDPFGKDSSDPFTSGNSGDPFQNEDPFKNTQSEDPFKGSDPFKSSGFDSDPFGGDPFKNEFGSSASAKNDPFGGSDPFGSSFPARPASAAAASSDPFGSSFPARPASAAPVTNDPFDPFGGGGGGGGSSKGLGKDGGDLFGSDPFAPTSRSKSESPTPALPPKQRRQPPPRPAPPRTSSKAATATKTDTFEGFSSDPFEGADPFGASSTGGQDPFASSGGGGGMDAFANFADFSPGKFGKSEDAQLAWATVESKKAEEARRKQLEQEQADLELAIKLSKADAGSSEA